MVSPLTQRESEIIQVDFETEAEPWTTLKLEDGTVIKLRFTVNNIVRFEGEHDNMGNPVYNVNGGVVFRIAHVGKGLRGEPSVIPTHAKLHTKENVGYQ